MAELKQENEDDIVTVALDPRAWIRVTVLISFAVAVVFILMYVLSGGGKEFFQRRTTLRTYFPDGSGLEKKAIVELDGIKVGTISSVELSHSNEPTRVVRVNISLNQKFLSAIPVDSQTEITADNLLGGKYVNIHRGVARESVKAGDELFAKPPSNDFNPADLMATLQQTIKKVDVILDTIDDPSTQLGQLVKGDALYNQLRDDIAGIQRAVSGISNPKSPAGKAVFGTELYDQLRAPILDIDKQLAAIERGEGTLGHAYVSSDQYDSIRTQISDFRKAVEGYKSDKLLTDDRLYTDLLASLSSFSTVITELSSGPMFDNAQLYESLNGSSRNAERFLKDFRNNPKKYLRLKVF